jgi:hypothetical protein
MNSFRVKHVLNEVSAILVGFQGLPNLNDHIRRTNWLVATLLREGREGYNRLHIPVEDYNMMRTNAALVQRAVLVAASLWNQERAKNGDAHKYIFTSPVLVCFCITLEFNVLIALIACT